MRRTAATLMFVCLTVLAIGALPAQAEGTGRCYPPPCASVGQPATTTASSGTVNQAVVAGGDTAPGRSPVPYVGVGLFAVAGSLMVVTLRRRSHIVRRSSVRPVPERWTVPVAPDMGNAVGAEIGNG